MSAMVQSSLQGNTPHGGDGVVIYAGDRFQQRDDERRADTRGKVIGGVLGGIALVGLVTGLTVGPLSNGARVGNSKPIAQCMGSQGVIVEPGDTFEGVVKKAVNIEKINPKDWGNVLGALALQQQQLGLGQAKPGDVVNVFGGTYDVDKPSLLAGEPLILPTACEVSAS